MLQVLRDRTHLQKDSVLEAELTSAQSFIWNRLITDDNGLLVESTQLTLAVDTSSYDLAAALAVADNKVFVALKFLGIKPAGSTRFSPVRFINSSAPRFISASQDDAGSGSPVYAASENFDQIQFAPPLLAGTVIRVDYIYAPAALNLATRILSDLPELVHQAIVDKATAQVFNILDDTREQAWELRAIDKFISAQNAINRRQYQQQPRTRPSSRGRW